MSFKKCLLTMVLIFTFAPPLTKAAANFVVNSSGDDHDYALNGICETQAGNGVCTLRAALEEANAAGGWHRITIGATTVNLLAELAVKPNVKVIINGAGRSTVIDGGGYSGVRLFNVDNGALLQLNNLTLANGSNACCGGGIQNRGIVDLNRVVMTGHFATASGIGGNPGRGAAIFNEPGGFITIKDSTLANNQARSSGGAIRNEGTLTVFTSTFKNNDGYAGGGGAIANLGKLLVYTSTFSGNHSAGAGAIWNNAGASAVIYSSTFVNNYTYTNGPSFALENAGTMVLYNSILSAASGGTNCNGSVTSLGFNLSNDQSCNLTKWSDQQGVDPKLGPLAQNGGPTETYLPLKGSPAIDMGFCIGFDQRGYSRHVNLIFRLHPGNNCDIGAVELQRAEYR